MTHPMIRVRAVDDLRLARVDANDRVVVSAVRGRFVARDAANAPLPDGEDVPDTVYYRAALSQGDLKEVTAAELAASKARAAAKAEEAAAAAGEDVAS